MSNGNFSQVLVIGGGSGGIAAAASLLKRDSSLSITLIEPSDHHYYQPGWTMVGGGIFDTFETERTTESVVHLPFTCDTPAVHLWFTCGSTR